MTILLADIGGTHIRFAVSNPPSHISEPQKLRVADYVSLEEAVQHYLFQERIEADDISKFMLSFSNRNQWNFDKESIRNFLPAAQFFQINDFEANAYGIIRAEADDLVILKKPEDFKKSERSSRLVVGTGTGLGLAYIVATKNGPVVQRTHGGHMRPAIITPEQQGIFDDLQKLKQQKTIPIYEDVLGGVGLYNVYKILCRRTETHAEYRDTHGLIHDGRNDPIVKEALKIYHEVFGVFLHQAAAFGHSYDGVYLTGGVVDRLIHANLFDMETVLKSFYQQTVPIVLNDVRATPLYWVKNEFISLKGLLYCAECGVAP